MQTFEQSDFVVTFTGESPSSRLIRTWDRVLAYIDFECFPGDPAITARNKDQCPELHDPDCWTRLDWSPEDQDYRHEFTEGEFLYCVGLQITRLTEPIAPEWLLEEAARQHPERF